MNKKLGLLCTVIISSMFLMVACNNKNTNVTNDKVFRVNIAHGNQPNEPIGIIADKWKELAEKESDGKLELVVYPSGQLGSEKDVVEQAMMGNNVVIFTGYDFLMDYVPDAGIITAPYLTDSFDSLLKLTETEWFEGLEQDLNEKGIDIVNTTTIYGARHLMTVKPVKSPNDLNGMKIRVPNNQMYIKTFESMGASPTPLPLSDTYPGLQQGLIDGAENPLPTLSGSKTNEVAKYLALTEHTKIISPWIAGVDFIDSLPPELVEILKETGDEAAKHGRMVLEKQNDEILQDFIDQGVEVQEVDINEFKKKTESVYKAFPNWSEGLYERVQKELEES